MKATTKGNGYSWSLTYFLTVGLLVVFTFALRAQTTATTIKAGTFALNATNIASLESFSDAQLKAVMQTLAATPLIAPSVLPNGGMSGNYYSLVHPDFPPMPGDVRQIPVWNLGPNGDSEIYLLDDLDYPPAPGDGGTNGDGGGMNFNFQPLVFTSNDLWLQLLSVTNGTANLIIHPPWNHVGDVYNLLYCTNLASPDWQWLRRTDPGQTNLAVANATDAQGFYRLGPPNDIIANDSLGTNFWVAFFNMLNNPYGSFNVLSFYISSPAGATGAVTLPGLHITNAFSVAAGAVTRVDVTNTIMIVDYDDIETNGIQITASQPVSVYGVNYVGGESAAFTAYPTPLLGTNYCVMAYTGIGGRSQFAILATEDDTTVTIMPTATETLYTSNVLTLQAGQTYQDYDHRYPYPSDVTGTRIQSDKPIAVFAGNDDIYVPSGNTGYGNPLVQEQVPVETWGSQALSMGFAGRTNGDTYRVLAAYDNTTLTVTGMVVTVTNWGPPVKVTMTNETLMMSLTNGQSTNLIVAGPVEFQADQPIQVAHFANGGRFDDAHDSQGVPIGDPCEILVPPTGHYLQTNIVFALTNDLPYQFIGDFYDNYLNLIVPQSAVTNTLVDNSAVATTNFVAIGSSGYYGAQITLTNSGTHTVTSSQPVGVEVYGFGNGDAYGYFGGMVK
jgi:IgGFc binding protein